VLDPDVNISTWHDSGPKYDVYFVPHTEDHGWATIFIVNSHGIFGETIKGQHNLLTQGLYGAGESPITFSYDFETWRFTRKNPDAERYIKMLLNSIHITGAEVRDQLTDRLAAKFSHDYLCGYFETTSSDSFGTWFLDYSPALGKLYEEFSSPVSAGRAKALLRGQIASPGRAQGKVRIVLPDQLESIKLNSDEVLVCHMTTPDYLPLMKQAAAIVTDLGGILSHAAIVARELGKPCITATGVATQSLGDGQLVEVDADLGEVRAA